MNNTNISVLTGSIKIIVKHVPIVIYFPYIPHGRIRLQAKVTWDHYLHNGFSQRIHLMDVTEAYK